MKQMAVTGELGDIQYMQAAHPQDMEGWPSYWESMVPMHCTFATQSSSMPWSVCKECGLNNRVV
jgi:hypothetical protein